MFSQALTWPYYQTRTDTFSAARPVGSNKLAPSPLIATPGWNDRKATLVRGTEKKHPSPAPPSKIIDSAVAETTGNPASTGTFRTCAFIMII
ncbi:hypothetical protein CDAR_308541 [Caerostris darwini]|uniref:Uncharacterized protein n=1 Tax=Caerostris darwini TaxID=1538125 RepID=A0AAV4WWA7_9ARAC|nr:hypothetical protein CDAR_308541 [Caerostris darwini]